MFLKILGLILLEIWIKIIIIITLILINIFQIDFNPPLLTTMFLFNLHHIPITTTSAILLINKFPFRKPATLPHKISEVAFRTLVNKLLSCLYSPILRPVQQESIFLVLPYWFNR